MFEVETIEEKLRCDIFWDDCLKQERAEGANENIGTERDNVPEVE